MKAYNNKSIELEAKITALKIEQNQDFKALKNELNNAYEELRPSKLLNRAILDIKDEKETKNNLLEVLISITGGYFSKKLLIGKSNGMFKSLMGYAVQYFFTKIISKNIK